MTMNISESKPATTPSLPAWRVRAVVLAVSMAVAGSAVQAQSTAAKRPATGKGKADAATPANTTAAPAAESAAPQAGSGQPLMLEGSGPAQIGPSMSLVVGKSTLVRLSAPIERISVGNPSVADVTLINSRELYLLGKAFGSTNVMMWSRGGPTTIIDVVVSADAGALKQRLQNFLPEEKGILVEASADSLVLSGVVSSALKADYAVQIAETFIRTYARGITLPVVAGNALAAPGQQISVGQATATAVAGALNLQPRVVNLMRVAQPQQVMLEVKVAEVSKTLLDQLGSGLNVGSTSGSLRYGIITNLLAGTNSTFSAVKNNGNSLSLDAQRKSGLVKILAEPNIVSMSGQEASFLAGGKIFIPVARTNGATGIPTITLEEKEFGVGLKFTPTVLDGGRIHLKVAPEVSELSQTGSPFTTDNGVTSVLPSFTTRRAQTSVQLMDGQSFAIAGLIKNNVTETIKRIPMLGEVPVLGALFRSAEFQGDRTELMFVITPRLVKPLGPDYALPTDSFTPPSRAEFFLNGQTEGSGNGDVPPDRPAAAPADASVRSNQGGGTFQIK